MSKESHNEQKEEFDLSLNEFLGELQQEGIATLSSENIKEQLNQVGTAIITRDFNCGIRISKSGSKSSGYQYHTWTTNSLEDPEHPISKKFSGKNIIID